MNIPILLGIMGALMLTVPLSATESYGEPGDCDSQKEVMVDARYNQMFVTAESRALFDIGKLNAYNTALGAFEVTDNDCERIMPILENELSKYFGLAEQTENTPYERLYLGYVEGFQSAIFIVSSNL